MAVVGSTVVVALFDLQSAGVAVVGGSLRDCRGRLLLNKIGEDRVYPTLPTAVAAYQQWCRAQPPSEDQPNAQ